MSEPGPAGIQVIARTAEILRVLHAAPDGMSQAELGEQLGLARSTVHRLLAAMRDEGLVESQGPRGRYRLGPAIHRMAGAAWRSSLEGLHPLLERLAREVDETVHLCVLERDRVTIADQVTGSQRLRAVGTVGESLPLHCTAGGKALLATMDAAGLARALPGPLARLTAATITDRAALAEELALTRERGYALAREEYADGVCASGVFLGLVGGVPAAVAVPQPAQRFYGHEDAVAGVLTGWAAAARERLALRPAPQFAPVDLQDRAHHGADPRAGEERDGVGYLLRAADPAERHPPRVALLDLLQGQARVRRVDL